MGWRQLLHLEIKDRELARSNAVNATWRPVSTHRLVRMSAGVRVYPVFSFAKAGALAAPTPLLLPAKKNPPRLGIQSPIEKFLLQHAPLPRHPVQAHRPIRFAQARLPGLDKNFGQVVGQAQPCLAAGRGFAQQAQILGAQLDG